MATPCWNTNLSNLKETTQYMGLLTAHRGSHYLNQSKENPDLYGFLDHTIE